MQHGNDDQFEQYLRQFEPRALQPLPVRRSGSLLPFPALGAIAALISLSIGLALWKPLHSPRQQLVAEPSEQAPIGNFSTLGPLHRILLTNPSQLDSTLADASRHLLPDVEKPGGMLHALARE